MFCVYVLRSLKDGKYYTGFTPHLEERLKKHNAGRVVSTKGRRPLELIYAEACLNKIDVVRREKYLKSGRGKLYLRYRLKFWSNSREKL